MTHEANGQAPDPHASHRMSGSKGNHDRHAGHSVAMFRDKFWLSLVLTIRVIFWSTDVQRWLGYTAPSFPGSRLIPAILGTVVFVYGGLVLPFDIYVGIDADGRPGCTPSAETGEEILRQSRIGTVTAVVTNAITTNIVKSVGENTCAL
jgi:Cu2+-exporting ATPase